MFKNKKILITGGTGSFGVKMAQKLLSGDVGEVIVFSRDETKQFLMRQQLTDKRLRFYIGDVRDQSSLRCACQGVDYLFHAAALKQVPSCELFPMEALKTNILGSQNVIDSVLNSSIKKAIFLSTDKAVYPINAMGMSKALMERLVSASAEEGDKKGKVLATVRYGNVMCSRGSVIPLFVDQIKKEKPVTVTNGSMTRFLLSLDDAIDLVFKAFVSAKPADLLIKKAPACSINELVTILHQILKKPLNVENIGIRHGEKIHETLATFHELDTAEDMGGYYRIPSSSLMNDVEKYLKDGTKMSSTADYSSDKTQLLTGVKLKTFLQNATEFRSMIERG